MYFTTLLQVTLAATASAATLLPRAGWVSGPFAIKVLGNGTDYDNLWISPKVLNETVGVAGVSSEPSYSFYYLERSGQLFTANNFLSADPEVRAAQPPEYSNKLQTLSWSYEAYHDPAKPSVVSPKKGIMQSVFFAYEGETVEEISKEKYHPFVVFDIRKRMVEVGWDFDVWYMCSKSTVDGYDDTFEALSLLHADEERSDCVEITLKTYNLPKASKKPGKPKEAKKEQV